jgi:O-antigen/teichoic acid export membrane protein
MKLARLVVLARLLSPEDFGLFGIVILAILALETCSQTGFTAALIQRREGVDRYLDVAWTVEAARGLILAVILFAAAPLVSLFFGEPRATALLRLMCISTALRGFTNIGVVYFRKELQFHRQVLYETLGGMAELIAGVVLAFVLRSVWALVYAGIAGSGARCLLSYALHPYRPRLHWDRAYARELFGFGKWMLGTSLVCFLALHGDDVFLGKMMGAEALGLYQLACLVAYAPATWITHVTSGIMMPAYAKVQDDPERLGRGFLQILAAVLSLGLPLTVFIVGAAPSIIGGLFGAKWAVAAGPMQILALAGLVRAVAATGGPLFVATGRPHRDFWMNLCRVGLIACTIYPFTRLWGISGTAASVLLGLLSTLPIWLSARSIARLPWRLVGRQALPALALGLAAAVGVRVGSLLASQAAGGAVLAMQATAAGTIGLITAWIASHFLRIGPWAQARDAWRALRIA